MIKLKHAALAAIQILALQAAVALAAEEPLSPDQAFKLKVFLQSPNAVIAEFTPAKGHYPYKNRTLFFAEKLGQRAHQGSSAAAWRGQKRSVLRHDETYKKPVRVEIVLDRTSKAKHLTLLANYQDATKRSGSATRRNRSLST